MSLMYRNPCNWMWPCIYFTLSETASAYCKQVEGYALLIFYVWILICILKQNENILEDVQPAEFDLGDF
jgi:hypothetical protein